MNDKYPYKVEALPYPYNELEPYIDTETMKLHHDKHYQTYVDNLNNALQKHPKLQTKKLIELLKYPELIPSNIRKKVIDNGGGVYNHKMYFRIMKKANTNTDIEREIIKTYGSMDNFKNLFKQSAMNLFGSGWTWLVRDNNRKLMIVNTANQNTPLSFGLHPIMGIDLWEHAYYKKYDNRKAEYIDNWYKVINWEEVDRRSKKTSN